MASEQVRTLGADVGGTQITVLDSETGKVIPISGGFPSMQEVTYYLLAEFAGTKRVYIGAAGVIMPGGIVKFTNRPWPPYDPSPFMVRGIAIRTGNDMEPKLAGLPDAEVAVVKKGKPQPKGRRVVVTVSTGVGVAADVDGTTATSEGGHVTWQPMTETEDDVLRFLRRSMGQRLVSVEDVIGGRHMWRLYEALRKVSNLAPSAEIEDAVQENLDQSKDIGPLVTGGALQGDAFCEQFMEIYGHVLGQWLRNLALTYLATGGIYLTGGVMTEGVTKYLFTGHALPEAFLGSPTHDELLRAVQIYQVIDPNLAAKGAFNLAMRM